jgi:hypothetical protein
MSYHIHTAKPKHVAVHYVRDPSEYFEDDEMEVGPALILDDGGNQDAFVVVGSPEKIRAFAQRILDSLPVELTEAEETFLNHICRIKEYDREAGSVGRTAAGWAWFLSDEDATGYDLTNGQEREVTHDD